MAEKWPVRVLSFFGPPGSGKGTVAQRCVKDLQWHMLSTGDLARKHIQEQTDLGKTLQEYVNKGHLIPDDLITQMVLNWLEKHVSAGETIILDGFPRTTGQASLFLQTLKENSDFAHVTFQVINFELDDETIVDRISNRLVCGNKNCQAVYSRKAKPPKVEGVCDLCGSELIRRDDDDESVVRERLKVFAKYKDDLLGYYKKSNEKVIDFAIPEGDPDFVFEEFNKIELGR